MAEKNILETLVPGFSVENPSETDREKVVTVAVREYIEAWSHETFARDIAPKAGGG